MRRIEDSRMDDAIKNPMKIAESWFTNSWFYNKMIPTPMKEVLQSSIPTSTKKMFVDLAGDKGILLAMNKVGRPQVILYMLEQISVKVSGFSFMTS